MAANIKLTKTMLDKSIIDANKTVQSFLYQDFGMDYTDKFFTEQYYNSEKSVFERNKFTIIGEYIDGTEANIIFYRSGKRGDKRISIQKLKQYADAGNEVRLISDSESDGDGTRIFISIYSTGSETDAA
tara:strand:+ start:315 stop:701 length:387 start_codon:yes stop_codon:yes gene_type:complete